MITPNILKVSKIIYDILCLILSISMVQITDTSELCNTYRTCAPKYVCNVKFKLELCCREEDLYRYSYL